MSCDSPAAQQKTGETLSGWQGQRSISSTHHYTPLGDIYTGPLQQKGQSYFEGPHSPWTSPVLPSGRRYRLIKAAPNRLKNNLKSSSPSPPLHHLPNSFFIFVRLAMPAPRAAKRCFVLYFFKSNDYKVLIETSPVQNLHNMGPSKLLVGLQGILR